MVPDDHSRLRSSFISSFPGLPRSLAQVLPHVVSWSLIAMCCAAPASAQRADPPPNPKGGQVDPVSIDRLSETARAQIRALAADKSARSIAQRKIASTLLYAAKARRGARLAANVPTLRGAAPVREDGNGRIDVEIRAQGPSTKPVAEAIRRTGGEVLYGSATSNVVRALVPVNSLEELAELGVVRSIRPTPRAVTQSELGRSPLLGRGLLDRGQLDRSQPRQDQLRRESGQAPTGLAGSTPAALSKVKPSLAASQARAARANRVREGVRAALAKLESSPDANHRHPGRNQPAPQLAAAGDATTAGDVAHRAAEARTFFGVTGAGVKIGVLSDSVDFLEESIASGDLPPDVTVLPGQSGVPGTGEGTAMLEIVHDIAPGAKLYFATAFAGLNSFADNIRALRDAGCDVIVDDVLYAIESPFQDGLIAQTVNDVAIEGAVYVSSAGNDGNFNDGTSTAWEGDFRASDATIGVLEGAGLLHDFGSGAFSNRVETTSQFILALFWSDAFGESGNDYDLYILDGGLTQVLAASTDVQDGDDDPFEGIDLGAFAGERIVVVKASGETRALHLNNFGGELGISTPGSTHGHNSAEGAIGVAAINAAAANGGVFTGGATNQVELFSSDGYRRIFYDADGNPYSPGNVTFGDKGGEVRRKPDLTAADGVATTVPRFEQFFGTSASAPHVAAIASLLKSSRPTIRPNRVAQALTRTALDIEATGRDRDSGHGIVDAFEALMYIDAPPAPYLELGTITSAASGGGDGDEYIEPGESGSVRAELINIGGATALNVRGILDSTTPGVRIDDERASYPNIGSNGGTQINDGPFRFTLSPDALCGIAPDFTLTTTYRPGSVSPQTFSFRVPTGQPGDTPVSTPYAGPVVAVPDGFAGGVSIPFEVGGVAGAIADLKFRFGGSACSAEPGAETVGLEHSWVGDLIITLTSPQGTSVTLVSRPGGVLNEGNNFCNTVFDDGAAESIQEVVVAAAPYTGSYRPASALAAFDGEDPNGTWTLHVSDNEPFDLGNVRAFALDVTTYECDRTSTSSRGSTTARR